MSIVGRKLDPHTLLAIARRVELRAQRIYDERDAIPFMDGAHWQRLDGCATELSKLGARLTRQAKSRSAAARKKKR